MSASATMPAALSPHEWRSLKVTEKKKLTDNTVFVRFGFSDPEQVVGMHVSSCLITRAQIVKGKDDEPDGYVIRPYTPVSRPQVKCVPATNSQRTASTCKGYNTYQWYFYSWYIGSDNPQFYIYIINNVYVGSKCPTLIYFYVENKITVTYTSTYDSVQVQVWCD